MVMIIKSKKFNMAASMSAFVLGSLYVLSDGASVTANVVGASNSPTGFTSLMGILIVVGSIGLFIVSMHHSDLHSIDLERHMRQSNHHEHIDGTKSDDESEEKE